MTKGDKLVVEYEVVEVWNVAIKELDDGLVVYEKLYKITHNGRSFVIWEHEL